MGIRLWVDDKRPAPDGWRLARTAVEAIHILATEEVDELALDHDLGHCDSCTGCDGYKSRCGCTCHWSGYSVALFLAQSGRWPAKKPTCHSANPAGRANIEATIERYFGRRISPVTPGEFRLTWKELARALRFQRRHSRRHGRDRTAIGGRFSYSFSPTSIGTIATIHCACRKKLTLTDPWDL